MERQKRSGNRAGFRVIAIILAVLLVFGTYVTLHTNIRFSKLKYAEETARYAAEVTGDNTEYLSENRLQRAWKYLKSTVTKPETFEEYELYASIAIAREDYENAVSYLQGCIDTFQGSSAELAVLYLRKGSLYILMDEKEKALEELNKSLDTEPELAPALYLRANLLNEAGDPEKALEDCRAYVRLDTAEPAIKATLAAALEEAGDLEGAILCYTAGLESEETPDPHLYVDRARCKALLEDSAGARQDLETYFGLTEEDPQGTAAAMLAAIRMQDGEYAEAAELFHRAADSGHPQPALLYEQSMMCSYTTGDYAAAAEDGEKAIAGAEEAGEDRPDLFFWTGMAHLALGEYSEAMDCLSRAKEKDQDFENIHYYLGVCAIALEQTDSALTYFTEAIERNEEVTTSLYNRAVCYLQLEKLEEAKADLRRVKEAGDDKELAAEAEEILAELEAAETEAEEA